MKPLAVTVSLLLVLLATLSLNAQRLYTWTDENGVVHLTDQPPPETDKEKKVEVLRYNDKTPQEIEAIRNKKENLRRKLDKEKQIEIARQAEIQAAEAEEQAQEIMQRALEEYEYNNEYIRRLTSTKRKRKKFSNRVERLKAETEASLAEAKAAVKQAEEATQRARSTAAEAQ
jgi:Domain of unknown function (DUF4124)